MKKILILLVPAVFFVVNSGAPPRPLNLRRPLTAAPPTRIVPGSSPRSGTQALTRLPTDRAEMAVADEFAALLIPEAEGK